MQLSGTLKEGSDLTICYVPGGMPRVLKALTESEVERAERFKAQLAASGGDVPGVTEFQLHLTESAKGKRFMSMPIYPITVHDIRILDGPAVIRLWDDLRPALEALHRMGVAHNDIKPSNICIREMGSFILIDVCSIAPFGETTASTTVFQPMDFKTLVSSPALDWWMLAGTLAFTACGDKNIKLSTTGCPARAELYKLLGENLPARVMGELAAKLSY
jgi:hypothetical protein